MGDEGMASRSHASRWLGGAVLALACLRPGTAAATPDSTYVASIDAWHAERVARLRDPESWLSLAGLFWLEEGQNLFGSRPALPITLPDGKSPPLAGMLVVSDRGVQARVAEDAAVVCEGAPVTDRWLLSDANGGPTVLELGPLRMYVIERGGRLALRVKDRESPNFDAFDGIERFPVDPAWRVAARFEPYEPWKPIEVPDVTGFVNDAECPGALIFTLDGAERRFDVLSAEDGFFVVFGDATNGHTTYGGGRFLVVDPPADDGSIWIDFNTAYNPPCAFTPYATCPLPSAGNTLAVPVEAGERAYGDH